MNARKWPSPVYVLSSLWSPLTLSFPYNVSAPRILTQPHAENFGNFLYSHWSLPYSMLGDISLKTIRCPMAPFSIGTDTDSRYNISVYIHMHTVYMALHGFCVIYMIYVHNRQYINMSVKVERCIIKHKHKFRFSFSCTPKSIHSKKSCEFKKE